MRLPRTCLQAKKRRDGARKARCRPIRGPPRIPASDRRRIDRLARAVDVVGLKPGRLVRNLTPARQREPIARARAKSFHEGFEEAILSRSHGERRVPSLDHEVDLRLRRRPETKPYPVSLERGAVRPFHSAVFRFAVGTDPFQSALNKFPGAVRFPKNCSAPARPRPGGLAARPALCSSRKGRQHGNE